MRTYPSPKTGAFTLIELLVVIVTLAVLAIVVFPAAAGIQNKGGRLDCANNLRQIGQDSMIFAGENKGVLPVCTLGAANGEGATSNHLGGVHYTRYVYLGASPNTFVTTNEPPLGFGNGYQNLGYLYQAGMAGNGNIFYCPDDWGSLAGANAYSPLLTADSTGVVRSSYLYNPRVVNPTVGSPIRRYQTTSNLEPHKLFAVDYFNEAGSTGVNPATIQHIRDRGWNVLFTDGGVQFSRLSNSFYNAVIANLSNGETVQSFEGYDQLFNALEQDH